MAHTAHLQSATKAKSDYNSKAAQGVESAAKLVKEATNSLVNETKQVAFKKEQDAANNAGNSFGNIKAEMELEANIQRLRAQLEGANKVLTTTGFTSNCFLRICLHSEREDMKTPGQHYLSQPKALLSTPPHPLNPPLLTPAA